MKFRVNSYMAADEYEAEIVLMVEDLFRGRSSVTVTHHGVDGTVIEASESVVREVISEVGAEREACFEEMAAVSSSDVGEYEEKRKKLKSVRNRLQGAVEDSNHQWRVE